MNNLELFSKLKKRRNHSILTQAPQKLYKNASEHHKYASFYRVQKGTQLSSTQNSKVLPKNILYDKQSLYLQVLSLKVELNQVVDQNIKLKTKIINLQKQLQGIERKNMLQEKSKMIRYKRDKGQSKNNQGIINQNNKKKMKEVKRELELLRNQNIKLKKNAKISKINELQIENGMIVEQNRRLSVTILELKEKLEFSHLIEQKNKVLQRDKSSLSREIHHLQQQISTMKFYIKTIQIDRKYQITSLKTREKPQESYTFRKRKNLNGAKHLEDLRKQFLNNKEVSFRTNKKVIKLNHNILPIRKQPILPSSKQIVEIDQYSERQKEQTKEVDNQQEIYNRNSQLQEQIKFLKKQNQSLTNTLKNIESKGNTKQNFIQQDQKQYKITQKQQSQEQRNEFLAQTPLKAGNSQFIKLEYNSVQGQVKTEMKVPQQHPSKAYSQPQIKLTSKSMFKSNKLIITQICQLLTYRMMAQRYTYSELQADIEKSPSKQFTYVDLCHMFVNQPFFLTVQYCRTLLCFMLEKQKPSHNDCIGSMTLIAKLRKVIKDFDLASQEQQTKMIENCADIITTNSKQIKQMYHNLKRQDKLISESQLKDILLKVQLSEKQINMITGQLSICSHDLSHLNLDVLFERFDLNEVQIEQQPNNTIEEAQNDDSFINKSKNKEEEISKGNHTQHILQQDINKLKKSKQNSNYN